MSERKERGILFNGEMVKALLAGTKTQTRRLVKPQPHPDFGTTIQCCFYNPHRVNKKTGEAYPDKEVFGFWSEDDDWPCPYGKVGDVLYVKETFRRVASGESKDEIGTARYGVAYKSDGYVAWSEIETKLVGFKDTEKPMQFAPPKWKPSIFMPRAASRIHLEIVAIRVERLHDISEADAEAEGAPWICVPLRSEGLVPPSIHGHGHKMGYFILWESIHGQGSWAVNPWLWCLTFKRIKP